jgi:hypothetical protein
MHRPTRPRSSRLPLRGACCVPIAPNIGLYLTMVDISERDALVAWLNGYVDAITEVNGITHGHPVFSARAFLMPDVPGGIAMLLAGYFQEACSELKRDFPDLTVAEYQFEPVETQSNWLRWLHSELEQRLLPKPIVYANETDAAPLRDTRYHVAWKVMETLRMLTEDFQTPEIYRAKYARDESCHGYIYVIPLQGAHLGLAFQVDGNTKLGQQFGRDG